MKQSRMAGAFDRTALRHVLHLLPRHPERLNERFTALSTRFVCRTEMLTQFVRVTALLTRCILTPFGRRGLSKLRATRGELQRLTSQVRCVVSRSVWRRLLCETLSLFCLTVVQDAADRLLCRPAAYAIEASVDHTACLIWALTTLHRASAGASLPTPALQLPQLY